ncbi:MAG: carbamoyltransferase HypF [Anaerolineae bacterium]|nr:carbamoyltransferase HypF [Anaerolineae bacterium]
MNDHAPTVERLRLTVRGVVQGVGFRPFVYGLAVHYGLAGHVGNNSDGVFIEVEGSQEALTRFRDALTAKAPPLARIESVTATPLPPLAETGFTILASQSDERISAHIPADVGICDECLRELFDPADRRYRYPFINCTHCGPRFSIIRAIPYDRPATTMAAFTMCPACAAEYHDPLSRRFHAQPIACPECGPQVWYQPQGAAAVHSSDASITAAQEAIRAGQIVAVKGIGGFHLACDATNDAALERLRERKGRIDKPFAVMVRSLELARQFAQIDDDEAELLASQQRPILLLRKRPSALSKLVAPGNPYVGLMLPYTPLHYLLLDETPLVMTSGNLSGEPIAFDNNEALNRLSPLVDAFLLHDRPIHTPCDDSVLRMHDGHELPVRRSRGYTPFPIRLPFAGVSVLATGGELKNTFCLTHQGYAFLSQHIGDMENIETLTAFERAQGHLTSLYRAQPQAVVCDLHPDYLTTHWAQFHTTQTTLPLIRVQHHHAHIAAVMAEHGLDGAKPVIGLCLDGTGYGTDATIWGGEVLIADYAGFSRAAHLKPVPLPGGDAAVERPYRMALAHLWAAGTPWDDDLPPVAVCPAAERRILARQFETGFRAVPTSSMGRLFDAAASLLGLRHTVTYEAQAAIELEGIADDTAVEPYPFDLIPGMPLQIDPAPVWAAMIADWRAGVPSSIVAARFHEGIAQVLLDICLHLREQGHGSTVALSGGVFQNVRLLRATIDRLRAHDFTTLVHRAVPSNDGGLALGQVAIAAYRLSNPNCETALTATYVE